MLISPFLAKGMRLPSGEQGMAGISLPEPTGHSLTVLTSLLASRRSVEYFEGSCLVTFHLF